MNLLEFAYTTNYTSKIESLAITSAKENWASNGKTYGVLSSYIHHTFSKIYNEYSASETTEQKNKKICILSDNSEACFNTGLFTENFESIYGYFTRNNGSNQTANQSWFFVDFVSESDYKLSKFKFLPERAVYFSNIADLIFDYRMDIRINMVHILIENKQRLPLSFQEKSEANQSLYFRGVADTLKKRLAANYKLAVPQYFPQQQTIQLLVPLCLEEEDTDKTSLALVLDRQDGFYIGSTCLTLEMAYQNARLIAKPEVDWLKS